MFEYLGRFARILVTGPQRSGTTICARMIADDLGYEFLPEESFGVSDVDSWRDTVRNMHLQVLQCPAMCRYVDEFGNDDDLAVVMMMRPIYEIVVSQNRIEWTHERAELDRYGVSDGPISVVKYTYWVTMQRDLIKNAYDVPYHSLRSHRLWVPAAKRAGWLPRQTEIDK